MKKMIVLLAALALSIPSAQAQFRFGVKGGVSFNGVSNSSVREMLDSKTTGFYVGPTAQLLFDGRFGLDFSLLYAQEGINFKDASTYHTGYLQVPVNVKYLFRLSDNFHLFGGLGPYIAFKVSGDDSFNVNWSGVTEQWDAKSFGAGINFNAGFDIHRFLQLGVNYGLGLADNYKAADGTYSVQERVWSVYASFYF